MRSFETDDQTSRSTAPRPWYFPGNSIHRRVRVPSKPYIVLKRTLDFAASALLVLLLSPALAFIAILIKAQDGGPVLFRQERHGLNGSRFNIFKFRTMTTASSSSSFKQCQEGDPRVTRLGRLLRRTSLDELPQLFNVFAGTMSLVGPRPHAIEHDFEACATLDNYWLRYSVLPGMTGLAQVRGLRGSTHDHAHMVSRVNADLEYVEWASLALDMRILLGTIVVVLNGQNAN